VKGTSYKIVDDEIILEDDPRGEAKIDENGCLLGGKLS
jgi:chromatin structure-remodeling complex protein RSC7